MPKGPVIVNNTPLAALWSVGQLPLLHALYGDILMPQAVYHEFLDTETSRRQEVLDASPWLQSTELTNPRQALVYVGLDRGEAEVLALALERNARLVIIDELRGRQYAKRLGLPLTGTVGVVLAAKEAGLVPHVTPLLEELVQKGLYLSQEILSRARELAGEVPD